MKSTYTEKEKEAIANFIKATHELLETNLKVGYYHRYSGYTRIFNEEDFCFKKL